MNADFSSIAPADQPLTRPYWTALRQGQLQFQRCARCGHAWLPARAECPRCLAHDAHWEPAAGTGRLVSWVVFHRSYHAAFDHEVPYAVGIVELDEGPRMIARIASADDPEALRLDQPMRLSIRKYGSTAVPCFMPGPAAGLEE